ncbi:MAG: hypothetical protein RI993_1567 [Pseudomonadota bacterium]|jgi:hypothetical protein
MKQILQSLKTGATEIAEVPCPSVERGQLLIRTTQTLVSVGTEHMLVEFGKAGWIEKTRQQPDKVRMVMDKVKTVMLVSYFLSYWIKQFLGRVRCRICLQNMSCSL